MNDKAKEVFSLKPTMSFKEVRKLNKYLLRTKFNSIEGSIGSFKGKKHCEVCKNIYKVENFTSLVTQKAHKTSHQINCDGNFSM